jgi:hypothetical protein
MAANVVMRIDPPRMIANDDDTLPVELIQEILSRQCNLTFVPYDEPHVLAKPSEFPSIQSLV